MVKRGVLGGTFDPIHIGHLVLAREVKNRLKLDEVLFLPAGSPYLKKERNILPAEHRLAMVELAVKGEPSFKISDAELRRQGPTYTVDTIKQLAVGAAADDKLYFILGWDNLVDLPRWKEPQQLISICRLAAVPRVGYTLPDLGELDKAVPGLSERVSLLDKPQIDVSSSVIRERVAQGLAIEHLVAPTVARYIEENNLYQNEN